MASPAIELRSVTRLLVDEDGRQARYWIPAYQRGYRWARLQVTQLLDDIWDFIQSSEEKPRKAFYCLQPLVVHQLDDGRYEVVDGQQRLTTILILLDHCKDMLNILGKKRFSIAYETRDSSFLEEINLDRANENVDFHHICQAWGAIGDWLSTRDSSHALKLIQHLLNDDVVGHNVKFIWYELASGDDPVAAFTRLNVGKIPLTETELIRALFLRRATQDDSTNNLRLRIAYEWDGIERRLQENAIWYFLQNQDVGDSNRIGLIFRLAAQMTGHETDGEEFSVFSHFADSLKRTNTAESEWREVKALFMALEEWYEDRDLFHILGFLLYQAQDGITSIAELLADSRTSGKQEFAERLRRRVCTMILGEDKSAVSRTELSGALADLCNVTTYRNGQKVRSILLLFNLASLLQNRKSNMRFHFDAFKQESWDIEHIRSVNDDRPSRAHTQESWLRHCLEFLKTSEEPEGQSLAQRIADYLDSEPSERPAFEVIDGEILSHFNEATEGPDHGLANLTLLDSRTNRAYQNAVFAVKRDILLKRDMSGTFVPLCTRNVFLKVYSSAVANAMFWTEKDAAEYIDAIITTLTEFFLYGASEQ
ncbi:MAG: DUF262 domain-containing protein [Chloroflexota bacterium]|nr:DUF262 domain-containing protein [Chloroflexota bacterium]